MKVMYDDGSVKKIRGSEIAKCCKDIGDGKDVTIITPAGPKGYGDHLHPGA